MQQLLMHVENKDFRTFRKTQGYRATVSLYFEGQEKRKKKEKKLQPNKEI